MNSSPVNSPKDNSPLLCYSPETQYFGGNMVMEIQNSQDFSYANPKILNPAYNNKKHGKQLCFLCCSV